MSEKFPPLEDEQIDSTEANRDDTDFLKREAEVLGDEFKTEHDADLLNEENFEEQYPDIDTTVDNPAEVEDDEFSTMQSSTTTAVDQTENTLSNPDAEQIIVQWRERANEAIAKRDTDLEKSKVDLEEEAVKHIDSFYETYNSKKQQQLDSTRKEAEEFLKNRDEFFAQENTTWDRALQLINQDDAAFVGGRDRTKFKEILQRLKGKVDAPGA